MNLTNVGPQPILAGQPVVVSSPGNCQLADALGPGLTAVVGLSVQGAAVGAQTDVFVAGGVLGCVTATWDAITGQVGGLTPGATYYLAANGKLTTVPPVSPGSSIVPVGLATSTTDMVVATSTGISLAADGSALVLGFKTYSLAEQDKTTARLAALEAKFRILVNSYAMTFGPVAGLESELGAA